MIEMKEQNNKIKMDMESRIRDLEVKAAKSDRLKRSHRSVGDEGTGGNKGILVDVHFFISLLHLRCFDHYALLSCTPDGMIYPAWFPCIPC